MDDVAREAGAELESEEASARYGRLGFLARAGAFGGARTRPPSAGSSAACGGGKSSTATAATKGDFSNEEYVWISQNSTLPLFVNRVYPGLEMAAKEIGVKVRKAGPTNIDLAGYIATVEQECARKPAGVLVVGGWDPSLTEPVNKCVSQGVPTVVTDGDLPDRAASATSARTGRRSGSSRPG